MTDPRGLNHAMAHEEQIDGVEVGVYRASAVGYCEWALLAARMGIDGAAPPDAMQKVFDEGYDNEATILEMFYAQNKYLEPITISDSDPGALPETVELRIGETIIIRGHVDDLATHAPNSVLLVEAKAVGKSLWDQWTKACGDQYDATKEHQGETYGQRVFHKLDGLWHKYYDQVEVYMAATGAAECAFVVGRKPERVEGEETRALVEEISWVWLKPDPLRLARIKAKIATVEGRARGGVALPQECDQQVYPCPYYYLMHPQKPKVEARVIEDDELANAMEEFAKAGEDAKAADRRKAAAKAIMDRFFGQGKALLGETRPDIPIAAGVPVASGEWIAKLIERNMPESKRKAYTQRYYEVKRKEA